MGTVTKMPKRPICINHGCSTPVGVKNGKVTDPNPRWRAYCSDCQVANYGGKKYKPGVTPFTTGRCSNQDSHLGFACSINYKKYPHFIGMTEMDHKNGDHTDNRKSNLDELCPMCHKLKGKLSGDYGQLRTGERKRR
jgi:hypothetical protein